MKAKEYIIQKLVELGKKYRWMKYPMLAVVSLISLLFLALEKCMERPRRAVIALVCLVLIISQSWYLISVANDPEYPETANIEGVVTYDTDSADTSDPTSASDATDADSSSEEEKPKGEAYTIYFYDDDGIGSTHKGQTVVYADNEGKFTLEDGGTEIQTLIPDDSDGKNYSTYYRFNGWFNGTVKITSTTDLTTAMADRQKRIILNASWERIAYKLTYSPGDGSGAISYKVVSNSGTEVSIESIPSGESGYKKKGYTFEEDKWLVTITGDENKVVKGELHPADTISFSEIASQYGNDITLIPQWNPNHYTIKFVPGELDEGEEVSGTTADVGAIYDQDVTIPACGYEREGYVFVGWENEADGTFIECGDGNPLPRTIMKPNYTDVLDGEYILTAKWEYLYAMLNKSVLTYQYDDKVSQAIEATYKGQSGGDFTIEVLRVEGKTLDGDIVTYADFKRLTGLTIFGEEDIDGSVGDSVGTSIMIHGTVKTVLLDEDKPIILYLNLHDNLHPDEDTLTELRIYLHKRELEVTGVEYYKREYDGTDRIGIGEIYFNNVTKANIFLNNGNQGGTFSDANAGENKNITIRDIYVYDRDGNNTARYYTVPNPVVLEGAGEITRRSMNVTTAPVYAYGQDYILTGQSPEFTVEITEEDLPEAVAERDKAAILTALKSQSIYTCSYGPSNNYHAGTYDIGISNKEIVANYSLVVHEGKLKVIQEEIGEYDYRITGSHDSDYAWWYDKEPKVIPYTANYDSIYVLVDGKEKYTYDKDFYNKDGASISEEMAKDGSITIQLGNSKNGAVTAPKTIDIRVDITAPKIETDSIQVSTKNTGTMSQIGRFLSFGNFFKETVVITIPVYDNLSGPSTLTYFLEGTSYENGITVPVSSNGPNTGTVSIEVAPTYKGTIALLATDKAGNACTKADMIGVEGSNWWVVENTAPEIVDVNAVDDEGKQAYFDNDLYYKSVTVTVSVEDLDAGVAYLEWDITKDGMPYTALTKQYVDDTSKILLAYDFEYEFTESGTYDISVTAYDNAGNVSLTKEAGRFNVDGVGPAIRITPENYDDDWATEKTITFTITDTGSGIAQWTLIGPDNQSYPYTAVEGTENTYTFTVTQKGTYTIQAYDYAGNSNECELLFTRVSSEVPETPKVLTDVEVQASKWFTTNPTITITGQEITPDGTAVTNYYQMWKEGEEEPQQAQIVEGSFQLPEEGIYNIRVWAVSESGMLSAEQPVYQLKYDGSRPVIHDVLVTGKGTINQVTLRVSEEISGLASLDVIYDNNKAYTQKLLFKEISDGLYSASFTATMTGSYQIRATDVAGNVSYAEPFRPMNVIVTNVSGGSENGITIIGQVIAGSFEIASVDVKYGSFGMGYGYNAEELLVWDDDGNKAVTARLTNVAEDTIYYFRITATSTTGEVCEYSGSFRTGVLGKSGANVVGTVVDETSYMQRAIVNNISVMLYDVDDNIVHSINNLGSGDYFMFSEVPDGIYTIRATNGNSSVTQAVIIENGLVVAPEGQLKLVLRGGQKTDVEYEEGNSLHFVVDGLTDLFDDSTNFGDKEQEVIDNGGTIEFCMVVDELSESEVPQSDRALISQSLGRQERVLMYVDFSIWKRASFAYGLIWEEQVTAIAGGKSIQIVIPLVSDWVGLKNLSVIRVHGNSVDRLPDLDENPNTYTISSTLFSTYALVYTDETISTEDPNSGSQNPGNGGNDSNSGNGGASGSTSDISKVPNNNNNLTSNGSGSTPRTGDEAPILWVSILGLAAGILGSLQLKRRK